VAGLAGFTSKEFRATVGSFATGVTVVTTYGEEHGYGMTANAFSSVSQDPPLVLVCVMSQSEGSEHIQRNRCFTVNVLRAEQEPLSRYFASRDRPRGRDAFSEIPHRIGASGSPVLEGAIGYLDCRLQAEYGAGDHQIFIGEVLELGVDPEGEPLLFHGGKYKLVGEA
jgi:flavin reductase (DIM6/NTAB) family NADH-FMN oxidoreductase RutF